MDDAEKCAHCSKPLDAGDPGMLMGDELFHAHCLRRLITDGTIRLSRALSRRSRELIEQSRRRAAEGHGFPDLMTRPVGSSEPLTAELRTVRFVETTDADGLWKLAVQSRDGVVGHIFLVDGEYAYFAGRFNGLTPTFRDPSLERLKERVVAGRR